MFFNCFFRRVFFPVLHCPPSLHAISPCVRSNPRDSGPIPCSGISKGPAVSSRRRRCRSGGNSGACGRRSRRPRRTPSPRPLPTPSLHHPTPTPPVPFPLRRGPLPTPRCHWRWLPHPWSRTMSLACTKVPCPSPISILFSSVFSFCVHGYLFWPNYSKGICEIKGSCFSSLKFHFPSIWVTDMERPNSPHQGPSGVTRLYPNHLPLSPPPVCSCRCVYRMRCVQVFFHPVAPPPPRIVFVSTVPLFMLTT